jgi:ribose-phosphate pyrophosphokinase
MAKLVCDLFKTAGADRLVTIDLHSAQIQGFFAGPFDNLYAIGPLCEAVKLDFNCEDLVLISPDVGGVKRIENWSKKLLVQNTFLTKSRNHSGVSQISHHELVHQLDLNNKICLIVDDMADTMGTLCSAAKILKAKGASKVIAVVTHGVFSGKAFENLAGDDIDAVYVTNSLPQAQNVLKSSANIKVVDVCDLFSKVIMCCVEGKSISALFE